MEQTPVATPGAAGSETGHRVPAAVKPSDGRTLLAVALLLLGAGAALVALLGPLFGDVIRYHASAGAVRQIVGGDAAALFLAAPLGIAAGILTWRDHPAGPVLGLGPAAYALYMYSQLALVAMSFAMPGTASVSSRSTSHCSSSPGPSRSGPGMRSTFR